jgi:hypothetical protein
MKKLHAITNQPGKVLICILLSAIILLGGTSCNKNNSSTQTNATMTASVNGSPITFSVILSNSNGYTSVQGTSSNYTLTLVMKTMAAGIYTLGDQSTGYYATVSDNFGYSYSTNAASNGQITLTQAGPKFNGTFYFTATETSPSPGGATVTVTSGSCSNI